jgi:hypothetical protein
MIKKKAKSKKSKTTKDKPAKKKTSPKSKKERSPAAVRNDISKMVESGAKKITKAVMDQAMTGQLAPARFLFEMASIYPPSTDGSQATADEECLAKTLLRRLDLPDEPVVRDEEDPPKQAASAEKPAAKPADEDEGKAPGSEPSACNESKDSVQA